MATYLAKWGNKGFLVSPEKIVPLLSLSTGFARKSDTNNDTSGQPTTNTRGLELQTIQLETRYVASIGVDPRGQIEEWRNQFYKRYPLYINGQQFGPDLLELVSVDISNVQMDNKGNFLSVDVAITLEEYIPPETTLTEKKSEAASSGSGTSGGTKKQAMSAAPSSTEKTAKKVSPSRGGGQYVALTK